MTTTPAGEPSRDLPDQTDARDIADPAPATSAPVSPEPKEPAKPETKAARRRAAGLDPDGKVRHTRAGGVWVALISAAVLAIVFLVFILQNADPVDIRFLGFDGSLPLAVALLLSAVIGMLLIAVPGGIRIGQLRRALRKNARS